MFFKLYFGRKDTVSLPDLRSVLCANLTLVAQAIDLQLSYPRSSAASGSGWGA